MDANRYVEEIGDLVRTGPLGVASRRPVEAALRRVNAPQADAQCKPDDRIFLLFHPTPNRATPQRRVRPETGR